MQSSLKKTLYLGLAALSLSAVAGFATPAQAASKAKVTSDVAMTTKAETRNVTLTGSNAIYSKPGTVKGAKVVATTNTAKVLKDSKSSHKNFRAYRVAKTNRGSIYYKVVSYDKTYRGWVYGGKSNTTFAGGLTSYDTFKAGTLTADQKNGNFKLKNAGKDLTGVTYKQPAWTQYKIGRAILDTTAYKDATFSVDQIGTRTREGDTWVHVKNQNTKDTKADGWILLSNLTQTNAFNENAQIKVVVKDTDGKTIKTFNHTMKTASDQKKGQDVTAKVYSGYTTDDGFKGVTAFGEELANELISNLKGTGYAALATDTVNQMKIATGGTLTLVARKGDTATSTVTILANYGNGLNTQSVTLVDKPTQVTTPAQGDTSETMQGKVYNPGKTTLFRGVKGAAFSPSDALNYLTGNAQLKQLVSPSWTDATTGKEMHWVLTPTSAQAGTFGDPFQGLYTAKQEVVSTTTAPTNPDGEGNAVTTAKTETPAH